MGGSTTNFGFPYPTGGDPALVAKAFKDLADAVDGWLLEYKYQNVDRALRFGSDPDFNHPFVLSSEYGVFSVTPKWTATGTMQYRTSRSGSWSACTSGTAVTGSNYYEFKGSMDRVGLFTSSDISNKWVITGSNVKASGRLASTHSYGVSASTLATYCYSSMFRDCSSLTQAPALPAATLAGYCYVYMFLGCSSLTTAPALPAATLASNCYSFMFSSCSSLTAVPALPATTLATYCYNSMFSYCSSLTKAPALPATTLVDSCYASMFNHCSSLTATPALPATTLANSCYNSMFYSCSSLTAVPALPATTLANSCYNSMFIYCSSLEVRTVSGGSAINQWKIPKSANAVSVGSFALGAMFDGIKSSANQVASTPTLTAGNQLTLYVVNTPAE